MELTQSIRLADHSGRGYGEVRECDVRIQKSMFGYRLDFSFGLRSVGDPANAEATVLLSWEVDLYCKDTKGSSMLIGRMFPGIHETTIELRPYGSTLRRQIDLSSDDFVRLVDRTHCGDVSFEFEATPQLSGVQYPETNRGLLMIPHSQWLDRLNQAEMDRFELVTIRIPVNSSHMHQPFADALTKIRHAEMQYMRGDWIGAAASCRAAWNTVRSATPNGEKSLEYLLAPVLGEPRRRKFAEAIIKSLGDGLNGGVHLEGDVKKGLPPADLTADDALLCIHWYSVVIGYLSTITPST